MIGDRPPTVLHLLPEMLAGACAVFFGFVALLGWDRRDWPLLIIVLSLAVLVESVWLGYFRFRLMDLDYQVRAVRRLHVIRRFR